jgi:ubiquinol-cytochrome c reductase cytochrome c subunit
MMKRLLAATLALPLVLVAPTSGQGGEPPAATGKALYNQFGCYACHGYVGAGGAMSGPALAGRGFDTKYVFDYVRGPKGVMPLYRKSVLSDAQLSRIAEFVVHLPGARPAASVPELARLQAHIAVPAATTAHRVDAKALDATAQFAGHCAGCHGGMGEGGVAPLLRGGKARTADQIMAIIRNPPPGMPRLTPSPIPDADLPALTKYVEELARGPK